MKIDRGGMQFARRVEESSDKKCEFSEFSIENRSFFEKYFEVALFQQ